MNYLSKLLTRYQNVSSSYGNHNRKNIIVGVGSALVASNDDIKLHNEPLVKGSIIYNSDTGQISIADGETPPAALPDHKHQYYAPVGHSHIASASEMWRLSEPRLWYTDDLVNHPELIPLDGREITNDVASELMKIYPGSTLLTHPTKYMDIDGFQNETMTLSVSEFQGDFLGGRITNNEIDETNMLTYTDQWLTNSTDVSKEQSIIITFKNGHTYAPDEYWMIPAAGTSIAPAKERPTPRDWKLEGSNGDDWVVLDTRSDIESSAWAPFTINTFKLPEISEAYSKLKLTITKWNSISGDPLETGLRRLWIFGNKSGVFTMPNIESPSPAFTYVVPYRNLDIGLKHEAVGDVGLTSALPENFPAQRMPADGRSLFKTAYPELFAHIGHTQDKDSTILNITASTGTVLKNFTWDVTISDVHEACYIEIIPPVDNDNTIGAYSLVQTTKNMPLAWVLEGTTDGKSWDTIHRIITTTSEDIIAQKYKFFVDQTVADKAYLRYRITFTEWAHENQRANMQVKIFKHKLNEFYLPNITIEGSDLCRPYIVVNNTVNDVSSEVVSSMQKNVADLTKMVAELQAKLNEFDSRLTPKE